MPQPSLEQVHVNRPLTNISVAFALNRANMLAGRVFPMVPVSKKSDSFFTYPRETFLTSYADRRAAGAEAKRRGYDVDTSTYDCERDAIAKDIADPIRANADSPLDLDREATELVTSDLLLRVEIRWVSAFFGANIWDNSITASPTWDDSASDPAKDIKTAKRTILQNTNIMANTLVLGAKVFDDLTEHPDMLDRIKHNAGPGNPAVADEQALARVFGVERVFVARAARNTAAEGATASYSFVAGARDALLVYAAPSPGIMTPSGGYTFVWNAPPGGADSLTGLGVKRYRNPERYESDSVEANLWYDQQLIAASLGAFGSNVVAA